MAHVSNVARQGDCTMGWLAEREQQSDKGASRSAYWSEAISELLEDRGYRRALQDGFDPDALEVWGIDKYPTKQPAPAHACVFCWADMKNDVAASYRHQACSACIQALKDGRMPARLLPNGTFQIGRAYLAEVCSDAQVDALLRHRDRAVGRRLKPVTDEPIFGLGKSDESGFVNVDQVAVVPPAGTGDGGERCDGVLLEVGEVAELDTDGAFVASPQLDSAGCHVGRDFAGEVRHDSSSSVGAAAPAAASDWGTGQPTEEAPTREAGSEPSALSEVVARDVIANRHPIDYCGQGLDCFPQRVHLGSEHLQCAQRDQLGCLSSSATDDVLLGLHAGLDGEQQVGCRCGHDSSSSVGGDAAQAARVIGGSEQPTEEAPSLVEIDDVPLTMPREGLTPVIEAAAEAAAARLRRESQVRAEREREQELRLREERVWAAWVATTPRLFLLKWAREHATDTKTWPDGARQMAMCVEQLFDAVRGEREDLWRELLEVRRELEALRGAAGGVS